MNTSRLMVASVVVLAVTTGWAAKYDGADWAPENIQAKDLSKLAKVERGTGGAPGADRSCRGVLRLAVRGMKMSMGNSTFSRRWFIGGNV